MFSFQLLALYRCAEVLESAFVCLFFSLAQEILVRSGPLKHFNELHTRRKRDPESDRLGKPVLPLPPLQGSRVRREEKTSEEKTRQDKTRQDKTRQEKRRGLGGCKVGHSPARATPSAVGTFA